MTFEIFSVKHLVQFYETDLMGIVHHTNYLRFMEEARVAWAHNLGLIDYQKPESAFQFAVVETRVKHLKPARFGDVIDIEVQARAVGRVRIQFQYRLIHYKSKDILCIGSTTHVALDTELQPHKIPASMKAILEKEKWTETWLLNL